MQDIQIGFVFPDQRKGRINEESVEKQLVVIGRVIGIRTFSDLGIAIESADDPQDEQGEAPSKVYIVYRFHSILFSSLKCAGDVYKIVLETLGFHKIKGSGQLGVYDKDVILLQRPTWNIVPLHHCTLQDFGIPIPPKPDLETRVLG